MGKIYRRDEEGKFEVVGYTEERKEPPDLLEFAQDCVDDFNERKAKEEVAWLRKLFPDAPDFG